MGVRFAILITGLVVATSALIFHLYQIQLINGEYFSAKAESQFSAAGLLIPERGTIYFTDKNGNLAPAAINKKFPAIYAVPAVIEDPKEAAARLSEILNRPADELEKNFSKKDDQYEILQKKADINVAGLVEDLKIKGIYVTEEPGRFYPLGPLAAQVLGFVGPNSDNNSWSGHYGLEEFYDKILAGSAGQVKNGKVAFFQKGGDLITTIDLNIQSQSESILENLIKNFNAESGSIIVAEPKTGKILTIANYPDFDPNNYGQSPIKNFLNPVAQQIYEPGSIFKVITMAAGIDAGKITPETTFYDNGSVTMSGYTIKNWDLKANGKVTMTNVIEKSINTGAVFAERQTGHSVFKSYLIKFGLIEKTGIGLPGELIGDISPLRPKAPEINFATASFGQGVAVTPLGLITALSAIANGGHLMRPYLDASLSPGVIGDSIADSTAEKVTKMMVSAVDKAQVAKIAGYSIAGKTGTAFIPDFKRGGYTDEVINTYVGFGPTSDPRFIILIKLNKPAGAPVAALTVVPAFRDLAQFILNYYNIPPDRLTNNQ